MNILETERLILREIVEDDSAFILDLLNQPSFLKFIGDRKVRSLEAAREFIETRYRGSYRANGFGLYVVELKPDSETHVGAAIGICGFVKRAELPFPDIGFAFLPQFEKHGFAFESAKALMNYGRDVLDFKRVLAVTNKDNESSIKLLGKLGFNYERTIKLPNDENELRLFAFEIADKATVLPPPTSSD